MKSRRYRSHVLLAAIAAICHSVTSVLAQAAAAQSQPNGILFNVPRQSAVTGVLEFARQADIHILVSERVLQGRETAAVSGNFSLEEGLSLLLAGSGLAVASSDGRTVTLKSLLAAEPAILETINVFGTLDKSLSIGSKSGQSLRETPKSVTVVTRERIEAQNLTSLAEALVQTTGVVVTSHSPAALESFYYSRGFRVQTAQLDGGAPAYAGGGFGAFFAPDTAVYERVEMLRGVDGMYTGAGEPGGVINLVRKRAKATPEAWLNISSGRWNSYRGELDVTGALTDDGRLRGRAAAAYAEKDYFYDRAHSEKTLVFGTAEYDLTPATILIAGGSYERRKEDGYFMEGFPRHVDGSDLRISRSNAFNPDWAHLYVTSKEVFTRIEHQLGKSATIKLNVTHLDQESEGRTFYGYGFYDPADPGSVRAGARAANYSAVQDLVDLSVSGTFSLFGRDHRFTVGTDYSKLDASGQRNYRLEGLAYPNSPAIDVFHFNVEDFPKPVETLTGYYPEYGPTQNGLYATVGLKVADDWRLTLGGRYGEYRYLQVFQSVAADGSFGAPATTRYKDSKLIPSVALTWDYLPDWSAYASFAETFEVQANRLRGPLPGSPLDPVTGKGYELGVKGEILGFLNTSAAIYRTKRTGQGIADPLYLTTPGSDGSSCCFLPLADVTTEGFDAEVSGTVLPGWQLFAGYTYYTNEYQGLRSLLPDGTPGQPSGVAYGLNRVPKHMFKMWTTWQLPGNYSRWTLNLGVTAQSENSVDAYLQFQDGTRTAFRAAQSSYALWNAAVQFRLTDTWTVAVYGENLLDETYYQVLGVGWENTYGMPRSYMMTLRGRW